MIQMIQMIQMINREAECLVGQGSAVTFDPVASGCLSISHVLITTAPWTGKAPSGSGRTPEGIHKNVLAQHALALNAAFWSQYAIAMVPKVWNITSHLDSKKQGGVA